MGSGGIKQEKVLFIKEKCPAHRTVFTSIIKCQKQPEVAYLLFSIFFLRFLNFFITHKGSIFRLYDFTLSGVISMNSGFPPHPLQ